LLGAWLLCLMHGTLVGSLDVFTLQFIYDCVELLYKECVNHIGFGLLYYEVRELCGAWIIHVCYVEFVLLCTVQRGWFCFIWFDHVGVVCMVLIWVQFRFYYMHANCCILWVHGHLKKMWFSSSWVTVQCRGSFRVSLAFHWWVQCMQLLVFHKTLFTLQVWEWVYGFCFSLSILFPVNTWVLVSLSSIFFLSFT